MRSEPATPDLEVAELASRQHGVITTAQLASLRLDRAATLRRVRNGRLHRVHRSVYAVGRPDLTLEGRFLAAVLASGDGAALSHRSAAELWGLMTPARGAVHVTVPTHAGRAKRRAIIVHRSITLDPSLVTTRGGVPVTVPSRTLGDLRRRLEPDLHQRALRRAVDLGLLGLADLSDDRDLTRSDLERRFLALCRRHRIPAPEVNARLGPYEVDFLWRDSRLVVETDGFRYHRSRAAFERDRARDADLQRNGYAVLRFTARRMQDSPRSVVAGVREMLKQR